MWGTSLHLHLRQLQEPKIRHFKIACSLGQKGVWLFLHNKARPLQRLRQMLSMGKTCHAPCGCWIHDPIVKSTVWDTMWMFLPRYPRKTDISSQCSIFLLVCYPRFRLHQYSQFHCFIVTKTKIRQCLMSVALGAGSKEQKHVRRVWHPFGYTTEVGCIHVTEWFAKTTKRYRVVP